jgi:hypothetical protein
MSKAVVVWRFSVAARLGIHSGEYLPDIVSARVSSSRQVGADSVLSPSSNCVDSDLRWRRLRGSIAST